MNLTKPVQYSFLGTSSHTSMVHIAKKGGEYQKSALLEWFYILSKQKCGN
jgi:hypothetical protein